MRTTGQPAASAGASLCATRLQGKLKGEIAPIDPDRPAQRERDLALAGLRGVHRDDVAGELARLDRREGVGRHRARRLDARGLDRLARLVGDRAGHVLVPLAQQARDPVEDRGALVGRQRGLEGARGRVDRPPGVVGAGLWRTADDLTGVRGAHLDPLVCRRRHMLRSVVSRDDIGIHLGSELVVEGATWPGLVHTIEHPDGLVLVDTGMIDSTPEVEDLHPTPHPLPDELVSRVAIVINTHLHFDHCGGNRLFPGVPIHVQRRELADARTQDDYTIREWVDFPGATYVEHDGEAEILPGVRLVPAPAIPKGTRSSLSRRTRGRWFSAATSATRSRTSGGGTRREAARARARRADLPSARP